MVRSVFYRLSNLAEEEDEATEWHGKVEVVMESIYKTFCPGKPEKHR